MENKFTGGHTMNTIECITTRRSIRKYKPDKLDQGTLEAIISASSFSPSWKHTQITRYIAIQDPSILGEIIQNYTPDFNSKIIQQVPTLIAITYIKARSGYERDGSFSTPKGDRWQMFDAGIASQTFCLAAHEHGLGTVILGIFDEAGITKLLDLPDNQELAALIAIGHPDPDVELVVPKRKSVEDLLTYK